jgi:hypothetical protein
VISYLKFVALIALKAKDRIAHVKELLTNSSKAPPNVEIKRESPQTSQQYDSIHDIIIIHTQQNYNNSKGVH